MDKLTAQEAAQILGYHINHLYRLLKAGTVKGEQFNGVWMIDRREADRIRAQQDDRGRLKANKMPTNQSGHH